MSVDELFKLTGFFARNDVKHMDFAVPLEVYKQPCKDHSDLGTIPTEKAVELIYWWLEVDEETGRKCAYAMRAQSRPGNDENTIRFEYFTEAFITLSDQVE